MKPEHELPRLPDDRLRQDVAQCNSDIAQLGQSLEQTRADLRRSRSEVAQYQQGQESHVRRTRVLWGVVALLIAGAIVFSWYGSPILTQHRDMLARVPVLQTALETAGTRISSAEEKVNAWAGDRIGLTDRMAKIEKTVGSNLRTVRSEVQAMARQIKSDAGQTFQSLQSRLSGVESVQHENSDQVARLKQELEGVRREMVSLQEENARHINQMQQVQQAQVATRDDVSSLTRRVVTNQNRTQEIAYQVGRERVDFELSKGRTKEVSPGIYLTVKDTNVARQRIDGWLQIASDGRILWLRDEGAQHPVAFSSLRDDRSYQLVVTRVGRDSASGYILAPSTKPSDTPVAATSSSH